MEEKPTPSRWSRLLRRGLIALAWLVSLTALYYGIVDWRGRHAWNEYRRDFESRVGPLEFKAYIPKEIPDSENFAATPFVESWLKNWRATNLLYDHDTFGQASQHVTTTSPNTVWRFEDLVAWQQALAAVRAQAVKEKEMFHTDQLDLASRAQAAPDVLEGFKDDEAAFAEMRAASSRPDSRYAVVYDLDNPWGILLPHLAKIKQTCQRLKIKACAELAAGQTENALDDVKLAFRLTDSPKTEPFLISFLVRLACAQLAIQPVWEGLAEHRWTDAQLQQLQSRLESFDWLADMQRPLHTEVAGGVLMIDCFKRKGLGSLIPLEGELGIQGAFWDNEALLNTLGRILPAAWYDREKIHYCTMYEEQSRGGVDETSRRVFPRQIAAKAEELASVASVGANDFIGTPAHGTFYAIVHHEMTAAVMLTSVNRVPIKAARVYTATDEAAIACALERYRLASGQFPETLPALVPRFAARLPNDIITGEPFKYRRTADGRFILYSVGWNETDDGGVPGKTLFDENSGDWVWEYPAL